MRPSRYARILLDRARPAAASPVPAAAAAPFAAHVRGRLVGLLDASADRSAAPRRAILTSLVLLLTLVLPLTGLRPPVQAEPAGLEPLAVPARPAARSTGGPAWWREFRGEIDEMRAIHAWARDPSLGVALPEGTVAGSGWVLAAHDAVVLPGAKHGCVFTSDEGYARVAFADGRRFGVSAFTHPPLGKLEAALDRMLAPLDLGTGGNPRAYHIEGFRTDRNLEEFRGVLTAAASASPARSESP
jgi:hypothetical protein